MTTTEHDCSNCYDTGVRAEIREGELYRYNCFACKSEKPTLWYLDQPRYRLTYDNDKQVDRICKAPRCDYTYVGY